MSLDQANAFRDYVSQNEAVQREIRSALMTESAKVSEIAAKHGFSFTSEEGEQAWASAQDNELSCLLYTSPSPRDKRQSRMPSSA